MKIVFLCGIIGSLPKYLPIKLVRCKLGKGIASFGTPERFLEEFHLIRMSEHNKHFTMNYLRHTLCSATLPIFEMSSLQREKKSVV